jgi:hypothetical protein
MTEVTGESPFLRKFAGEESQADRHAKGQDHSPAFMGFLTIEFVLGLQLHRYLLSLLFVQQARSHPVMDQYKPEQYRSNFIDASHPHPR